MLPFPQQHEPEIPSPWHGARAEGRVHEMSLVDKLRYVAKYLFAHQRGAPADILRHFDRQRILLSLLPKGKVHGPTLGLLGDVMWIRKGWGDYASSRLLSHLRQFDGLVGNLETVISKKIAVPELLPDYVTYNSRPELISSLRREKGESLFAALSFANNHVLDKGDAAAQDTVQFLNELNIAHSGLQKKGSSTWSCFERGGLKFGFYAATFGLNDQSLLKKTSLDINLIPNLTPPVSGIAPDLSGIYSALAAMPKDAIKIIYLHWGHEFESYPTARQMQVARMIVSAGADVIVGSGSHVAGPTELLWVNGYREDLPNFSELSQHTQVNDPTSRPRKAIVFYSLGNFANAMFTFPCRIAQVRGLQFAEKKSGVSFELLPTELFYNQFTRAGVRLTPLKEELSQNSSAKMRRQTQELLDFLGEPELAQKFALQTRKN